MYHVIRNGSYFVSEELEPNDIQVDPRPNSCAVYENYEWVNDERKEQVLINETAVQFLNASDWKVIRHRDQLALGIETSLNEEEYKQLLQKRQEMRERVERDGIK